jgi:hypothetical protein
MAGSEVMQAVQCPGCGSHHTVQVTSTWPNVLCRTCGACWAPDDSGFSRVDVTTCPGCVHVGVCRVANG